MLRNPTWRHIFPGLTGLPARVSDLLNRQAVFATHEKGALIFGPGIPADNLLLLVSGTVRVQRLSETGREIVLYRMNAGENCMLTTACLLAFEDDAAEGVAETNVDAILIPRDVFDDLMSVSKEFRASVFGGYSKRVTDLFRSIEDVAFTRIDSRVAQKLLEMQDTQNTLHLTHQQMAAELGTARDVISRQLKELERRGWLALSQGAIKLRDAAAIERLAEAA